MKKSFRKLIPAILMVLLSASLMGTSTFAWFSLNSKVTVTGMVVETRVSENLFIVGDTLDSTAKKADNLFGTSLVQSVSGLLEPVSTIDGESFYYTSTSNAQATGAVINDEAYILYNAATAATDTTNYNNAFSENYGVKKSATAVAYVDYVFQLKAVATGASFINFTNVTLTYAGTTDGNKAFRVAIFVEEISSAPAGGVGDLTTILKKSDAAYFTTDEAVKDDDELDSVTNLGEDAKIEITAVGTKYYKVVVRMWIEGEDTTCNNTTFANLTDKWKLDLEIKLESTATNAKNVLTTDVTTAKTALYIDTHEGKTDQAVKPVEINGVTYNPVYTKTSPTIVTHLTKNLYVMTDTTLTASSRFFTIEKDLYPTEVTSQVTVADTAPTP